MNYTNQDILHLVIYFVLLPLFPLIYCSLTYLYNYVRGVTQFYPLLRTEEQQQAMTSKYGMHEKQRINFEYMKLVNERHCKLRMCVDRSLYTTETIPDSKFDIDPKTPKFLSDSLFFAICTVGLLLVLFIILLIVFKESPTATPFDHLMPGTLIYLIGGTGYFLLPKIKAKIQSFQEDKEEALRNQAKLLVKLKGE